MVTYSLFAFMYGCYIIFYVKWECSYLIVGNIMLIVTDVIIHYIEL